MKILLTNDDGYDSKNIEFFYNELSKQHDVWLIAPKNNCSGKSTAISFLNEIKVTKISERKFYVDGTPADCSYLGLLGIVDFEFDMVISGINHGANLGSDVIYSGTVGAAIGGRKLRYPPIAISCVNYSSKDYGFVVEKAIEIINKISDISNFFKGHVININFPDINRAEFKGIKITKLSERDMPKKPIKISEENNTQVFKYNFSGDFIKSDHMTDAKAISKGYVSISILSYDLSLNNFDHSIEEALNE